MFSALTLVLLLAHLSSRTTAQTTFNPSVCRSGSGVSSFSACNYINSQVGYCAGPDVAHGAPAVACYCNQQLFNGFFDCESELRRCFGNANNDDFLQSAITQWHSVCNTKIAFTATTPVVANITMTVDQGYCTTAFSACVSGNQLVSQCSLSHTDLGPQFSSCFCQPQILSLEYTCNYLGSISCNGVSAALTNIPAYTYCSNAASLLLPVSNHNTGPATTSASATGSLSSSLALSSSAMVSGTSSITRPTLPGSSSSSPTAQSTSSSTNLGFRTIVSLKDNIGAFLGILVIQQLVLWSS